MINSLTINITIFFLTLPLTAMHESNGLHIITALILNEVSPLCEKRMDLVLKLKNNASKLLLAIMESRADSDNAERILHSMNIPNLVRILEIHHPICLVAIKG